MGGERPPPEISKQRWSKAGRGRRTVREHRVRAAAAAGGPIKLGHQGPPRRAGAAPLKVQQFAHKSDWPAPPLIEGRQGRIGVDPKSRPAPVAGNQVLRIATSPGWSRKGWAGLWPTNRRIGLGPMPVEFDRSFTIR